MRHAIDVQHDHYYNENSNVEVRKLTFQATGPEVCYKIECSMRSAVTVGGAPIGMNCKKPMGDLIV